MMIDQTRCDIKHQKGHAMPDPCDYCGCDDVDQGIHQPGCRNADDAPDTMHMIHPVYIDYHLIDASTPTPSIDRTYEVNRTERDLTPKAAMTRLQLILDTPAHLLDERGFILSTNQELDDAQGFIRDNLDNQSLQAENSYKHLPDELAKLILQDLNIIWGYEFSRDEISHIAMKLSLCPLHFCDWASCFDDEDDDCAQIRNAFPHHHDT